MAPDDGGSSTPGSISFDPSRNLLIRNGFPVPLPDKSIAVLRALLDAVGRTVAKDELLRRVWPGEIVDESNLRLHIGILRRALGSNVDGSQFILNVPGRGYMFVLEAPASPGAGHPTDRQATGPISVADISGMIGRCESLAELINDVRTRRLVTLVGAGGIGKTTVARNLINGIAGNYADGGVFIDLSNVSRPDQLKQTLASNLGVAVDDHAHPEDLAQRLSERRGLVVLDNCEHLVEELAPVVEAIVRGVPELHLLVTSREPLRIEGEWIRRLQPLELPPEDISITWADALQYSAIRLFAERAEAASNGFQPIGHEIDAVATICRQLDGLPLALELVAPHCETLGIHGLLAQLFRRFPLFVQGRRTSLPRHKTLQATLDWSYDLLSPAARQLFVRLGTFKGRFSLDEAVSVCAFGSIGRIRMLDLISELVIKNMLNVELNGAEASYFLLRTTQDYARAKLDHGRDLQEIQARYSALLDHRMP